MNLYEQGWRFINQGQEFFWMHPLLIQEGDIDCTDMGDDEFYEYVKRVANSQTTDN